GAVAHPRLTSRLAYSLEKELAAGDDSEVPDAEAGSPREDGEGACRRAAAHPERLTARLVSRAENHGTADLADQGRTPRERAAGTGRKNQETSGAGRGAIGRPELPLGAVDGRPRKQEPAAGHAHRHQRVTGRGRSRAEGGPRPLSRAVAHQDQTVQAIRSGP